jgi:hypothetical protein
MNSNTKHITEVKVLYRNAMTLQSIELVEMGYLRLVKRSIRLGTMLTHDVMSESGIYELPYFSGDNAHPKLSRIPYDV